MTCCSGKKSQKKKNFFQSIDIIFWFSFSVIVCVYFFEFFERLLEVGFLKIGMGDKNGFVTDHNVSFRLKPVKRARN